MKRIVLILLIAFSLQSCNNSGEVILQNSIGKVNKALVVTNSSIWLSEVGEELKNRLEYVMDGLPQPEKAMSLGQVAPHGFNTMMKNSRNILVIEEADSAVFNIQRNKFAKPQTIIYVSAKDRKGLLEMVKKHSDDIKMVFNNADIKQQQRVFAAKRLDDSKYKTLQNLNISLTIPETYRTVDDTGEFLWLRQHHNSGIARGAGNSNILVYSLPLDKEVLDVNNVITMRDSIGQKYIPGSKEGMYMITEAARESVTKETKVNGLTSFETRGTWEVKNDFMAGPYINYAMVDKAHNRLLVVEGFVYAPSIEKREFVFELEAIAKSVSIQ